MKRYTKLVHPNDSAFGRVTWRTYTPIWLLQVVEGVTNIFRWIPTIYKDKDWDDYYITKMIQKKLEHQRAYLVQANRFVGVEAVNKDMTLALNLIELMHEDYYSMEYMGYMVFDSIFTPTEGGGSLYKTKITSSRLDEYFLKYPGALRRVKRDNPDVTDEHMLAMLVSRYNQAKCHRIFWTLMDCKSRSWWD